MIFYSPPTYHWYLAYLLIFYVLALLLVRAQWVRTVSIPVTLTTAWLADGELVRLLYLWAFFMAGDTVASYWHRLRPLATHPATAAICALVALPVLVKAVSGDNLRYNPVWAGGVFAAIFALRPIMNAAAPTPIGRALSAVGHQSIVYYVSHYLVVIVSFHILNRLGLSNSFALFFLITAVALFAGYVLVHLRRYTVGAAMFEWSPHRSRTVQKS